MILRITDGTTSCDLVWHSVANRKFIQARDGWAPQVAGRRRSQLGGRGPYADVTEEIALHVCGQTAAEAMGNLALLNSLIEQAEEWAIDARTAPTLIQYSPTDGDVWQAVIVGRARGDELGAVTLSPTFNNTLNAFVIENVRLRFVRMGLWLGTTDTVQSSAATSPSVQTVSMPAASGAKGLAPGARSPVKLSWDAQTTGTNTCRADTGGFVLACWGSSGFLQIEAESGTFGATFASVADAANQASGGNVLRYTPAGALGANDVTWSSSGAWQKVDVFASVKNNGAGVAFQITPTIDVVSNSLTRTLTAPPIVIDSDLISPTARWRFVGSFVAPNLAFTLRFTISALDAPAGATLDIDQLVLVSRDSEDVMIANLAQAPGRNIRLVINQSIVLDHQLLTATHPLASLATSGVTVFPLDYRGDIVFQVPTSLTTFLVRGLLLLTNGAYWRPVDFTTVPAFANVTQFKFTATRLRGTLVPQ